MELSKKGVSMAAGGAIVVALAGAAASWFISTSSAGVDAAEEARVKVIISEQLKLDETIITLDDTLTDLDKSVGILTVEMENNSENLDLLRRAVEQIADDL